MTIVALKHIHHPYIQNIQQLYQHAFPPEERRDFENILYLIEHNPYFTLYIISVNQIFVGFVTIWQCDFFDYMEHFAIIPSKRHLGIGSKVLNCLDKMLKKPLILEIEIPNTPETKARLCFYQRHGFKLWNQINYIQPSYHHPWLPAISLKLMSKRNIDVQIQFKSIVSEIYKKVYQTNFDLFYPICLNNKI